MRTLLVASTGGHLVELERLRERLVPAGDLVWATPDTAQSRSLLAGEEVFNVRGVAPRDLRAIVANGASAPGIIRRSGAERVVSTGAGIALAFLPAARLMGLSCHYIESAARTEGPSVTGRALQALRAAHLYTQVPAWASETWAHRGSVFDDLEVVPSPSFEGIQRVLVSCGTMTFPFERLVRRLAAVLPAEVEIVWQLSFEPAHELPGTVVRTLSPEALAKEMEAADLVVCHAGVGSALTALSAGHAPVLVPRLSAFGEHVDDHQVQVANMLAVRGLAVSCHADELELHHLEAAAAKQARAVGSPRPFELVG